MRRINAQVSDQWYRALDELATKRGVSKADILRDAVALEKWFDEAQTSGGKVLLQDKEGTVREVIPR